MERNLLLMKCVSLLFKMELADGGIRIIKKNVGKVAKYVLVCVVHASKTPVLIIVIFHLSRDICCYFFLYMSVVCCSTAFHHLCPFLRLSNPGSPYFPSTFTTISSLCNLAVFSMWRTYRHFLTCTDFNKYVSVFALFITSLLVMPPICM